MFFDFNWDGYLTCDELNEFLTFLANISWLFNPPLFVPGECWPDRGESICGLFHEIDLNCDGLIDYFEFQTWLCSKDDCAENYWCVGDSAVPAYPSEVLTSSSFEELSRYIH